MDDTGSGPLRIALPERLDRKMRLGPFPSSRDALKFASYAAVGGLLSPFANPVLWLPVVAAGFLLSVWRPDGQSLDERALAVVGWKLRSVTGGNDVSDTARRPIVRQALLQLPSHRYVAVVRTGGTPVAYLPPDELGRRFELFRELLRSLDSSVVWLAATVPIRSQAVRPPGRVAGPDREAVAFSGYSELVTALCRRRLLRRVYLVLGATDSGPDAIGQLEGKVANLIERLGALGLKPTRLRDQSLVEAARRFGWPVEVSAG